MIETLLKPMEQRFIQIDVLFIDETSGLVMSKLLDSFFIRPYHVKEEDKQIFDRKMKKKLCHVFRLKEGFSA